ncbi:MAG TPA: bifunctional oligoribonuclease/PAP phosphatase NrnA [Gemmatimonadaceae bacterium]|nr:bifunctional oligoribonuclease/PAP phosphatase NrnA [Gemmatimonadaceae bacterium]
MENRTRGLGQTAQRVVDLLTVSKERREAIERLAREFRAGRSVAISTHINADGDGCGSEVALAHILGQLGMTVKIVNPTPWPDTYDFLLGKDIVDATAEGSSGLRKADLLIVLDISDVKRLGNLADAVRALKTSKIVIDHHIPSDEPPSQDMLADTTACATGELIYDLAITLNAELTPEIATALYVAILTDTGGFRFSNTSARCLAVASQLLAAGVEPEEMYRRLYASHPIGRLHLLRDALATLEVDPAYGISWISVAAGAAEEYGLKSEDLEGLAEHPRSVGGTRMAIFFRDLGHGKIKASFRSTGDVNVNEFARQFGGGGHAKAAGALIPGTIDEVRHSVVNAAREFVGQR